MCNPINHDTLYHRLCVQQLDEERSRLHLAQARIRTAIAINDEHAAEMDLIRARSVARIRHMLER